MNFHMRQMSLWMKSLDINGREIRITSKEAVHLKYCQCVFSLRLSQLKSICTSETPPSCLLTHNSCAPSGSSTLMPGHTYVVRVPNPFFPSKALISQRALSQKKHVSCHRGEMDFKLLNKDQSVPCLPYSLFLSSWKATGNRTGHLPSPVTIRDKLSICKSIWTKLCVILSCR